MDWAPIRKGTLVEFAKNENDVVIQKCWHARMYHSSRMRSSHHFEKYEGVSRCKLLHNGEEVHRHGFPKIPTKNPKNRRNERQVKFPPVPGANKDLRPTLSTVQPTQQIAGQSNKKGRPMKSSLSMSYNEFQRLMQLQKPKRQYEKISYTKAVHFNNGIMGYAPASYPEEYYTPRTKLKPSDYDIYNNPHIQEQLRIQHEKTGGKDGDILPWLNPKHQEVVAEAKGDPPVADTLGQDSRKGDFDQINTLPDDDLLQDGLETKADDQVTQNETEVPEGAVARLEEVDDGGYQSASGADDPLEVDRNSEATSRENNAQEMDNNLGVSEGEGTTKIDSQNVSNEETDGDLPNEVVEVSKQQGIVRDIKTGESLDTKTPQDMTQSETNQNLAHEPPARSEAANSEGAKDNDLEDAIDDAVEAALTTATQELDKDAGNGNETLEVDHGEGNGNETQEVDHRKGNGNEAVGVDHGEGNGNEVQEVYHGEGNVNEAVGVDHGEENGNETLEVDHEENNGTDTQGGDNGEDPGQD
ncbi:uncharacterized protein LOC135503586 isoform X2 [Lineus longissimus]|uniref:uncharacterized protein LOC135503586 isoform X2 n=1 Tax=Lineus longissimus TaxID=88925 RepID=UPI00315D06C9